MKPASKGLAALVALLVSPLAFAGGSASPLADADKLMTLDFSTGSVLDCRTSEAGSPERTATIVRRFTRLHFDNCLWNAKVDRTDLRSNAVLDRVGADVTCVLEETEMKSMPEPDEEMLQAHLRSKGLDEVSLISSTRDIRNLGILRHQVARGRMPPSFGPQRPIYEISAWIWSGLDRLSVLSCLGPEKVMQADAEALAAVGDALEFGALKSGTGASMAVKGAPASH